MGPPSLVNFDIFLLHGVAASLRALPMSQSSVPPPSVAPGPDFYFDLYEETEVDGCGGCKRADGAATVPRAVDAVSFVES